jgi:hypothetical protein
MSVKIDVSLGEALDKLTILDIKKNKINDSRRDDVITEFQYLQKELHTHTEKYRYLYSILYKTNERIWECMDIIRESKKPTIELYEYIDETIVLNDSRYLIKKKINEVGKSALKEQKGYNMRSLHIILDCDFETINILNGAIRYYSFFYDEVILTTKYEDMMMIKRMFNDDPFIKINTNEYSNDGDCVKVRNSDITVNISHALSSNNKQSNVPYCDKYSKEVNDIYRKLGMNISIFEDYKNNDYESICL